MSESSDVPIQNVQRSQRIWYRDREVLVIAPVICLMFLCGITNAVEKEKLLWFFLRDVFNVWKLCNAVIPLSTMYLSFFLSEHIGRKPIIGFLFLLSIFTSILHFSPVAETRWTIMFICQCILDGGTTMMTFLAIKEYSSSKRMIYYILANAAVWQFREQFTKAILYQDDVIRNGTVYVQLFPVILGLVCFGLTWLWPESPHWLASSGKVEESRSASQWLHGDEGEEELQSILKAPQTPPPPKLFSLSLFAAILTTSLHKITTWYKSNKGANSSDFISKEFKIALVVCSSVFAIYCTTCIIANGIRKKTLLFASLGLAAVSFILRTLIESIAVNPNPTFLYILNIVSDVFSNCGPLLVGAVLIILAVPEPYKSLAYAVSSYINLGISTSVLLITIVISYK